MQTARRWLFLGISLVMFVFTGIRGWASPFHGYAAGALAGQTQEQPSHRNQKSTTFTGTVARSGDTFVLRDSSGAIFALDDAERARQFEGLSVQVAGNLDEEANLIHIESIEPNMA